MTNAKNVCNLKKKEYSRMNDESLTDAERKALLRGNMKQSWSRQKATQSQRKSSNIRVLILIGILLSLGYLVFNGVDDVDDVVKKLW